MKVRVSVVVPTYNRPHLLRHCLAALLAQEFDPAAYEIIVVDDAASERTRRLVEKWNEQRKLPDSRPAAGLLEFAPNGSRHPKVLQGALASPKHSPQVATYTRTTTPGPAQQSAADDPCLRYIAVTGPNHGPAAARNCGWCAARGTIIAFTDDDCIPASDWLRAGVEALAGRLGYRVGVTGRIIVPIPAAPTDYEWDTTHMQTARFLTANCFYRRQVLAEVGGFDERFTRAWREDSDLFFTLLKRYGHHSFGRVPGAVVVHPPRRMPWGVSLRLQRKSMFNALLYKKHPDLYRTMIQPGPPWHYYQILATLILGLGCAVSGQLTLTGIALLAWLLLTGRFCRQRLRHTSRAPAHVAEMAVTSAVIPLLSIFWRVAGALRFRVWFF